MQMPQQPMPERFSEWNEAMVARHDPELFHHHPRKVVRWVEHHRVSAVLKLLKVQSEHRVLEIGCGAGNVLARIVARERHALDLSRAMVARAGKALGEASQVLLGNAEELPYRNNVFDRVVCTSVLTHVYRPQLVLSEAYRVLKPGGRMVVSVSHEAAIERGIRLARALRLDALILGGAQNSEHEDVYSSEYHLHHFDLKFLRECALGLPKELTLRKVPIRLYPVHLVAVYEKQVDI